MLRSAALAGRGPAALSRARRAFVHAGSMRDASLRLDEVTSLRLSGEDVRCTNLMCSRVGGSCVCKLARWLQQSGGRLGALRELDLRDARLDVLPDPVFELAGLRVLRLAGNPLAELPPGVAGLGLLEELDVARTRVACVPDWLLRPPRALPALRRLVLAGSPAASHPSAAALAQLRPEVEVVASAPPV